MDIKVKGGQKLHGEISPSGSKNSAVAILPATLLFNEPVTLKNIPDIKDVVMLVNILQKLGSKINWNKDAGVMNIDNSRISFAKVNKEDWNTMRGTSLLWGPMLSRFKKIEFDGLPGGCTLGFRTLDPHFKAFKSLGVKILETEGSIKMNSEHASANSFWLTEMSPTATENALMLAATLKGRTKIIGAASEPQVQDLCNFLNASGAKITGVGSSILEIEGVTGLNATEHSLFSDHYEIATFLAMAAITGGSVRVKNAQPELFVMINDTFLKFGVEVRYDGTTAYIDEGQKISVKCDGDRNLLVVKAQPWPGLPVDLLPLFIPMALSSNAGQTLFHNWMYDSGLFWTSELAKLGANIVMCDPHRIMVISGEKLKADTLEAPYIIRATVAMVMAAMIAEGESTILNADALYRGHPHFSENLRSLGADIQEVG